jgi:hypothetical protein
MKTIKIQLVIFMFLNLFNKIAMADDAYARIAYEKVVMDFYVGAHIQSKIIGKLEEKCPQKEKTNDFMDSIQNDIKKNTPNLVKLMDLINESSVLHEAYATELIKNTGGCETDSFKEIHKIAKEQYSMFFLRWMQKKFN